MYSSFDEANLAVIERILHGQPFLIDVVEARAVIPELNSKTLLHAGPPIKFANMTGPMQGACIGASFFEGWASSEKEARSLLNSGSVRLIPCHHVNAVGSMGGITSGSMAVMVVENRPYGNRAYCTMYEGIGKALLFGAYSPEIISRLKWMATVLGPSVAKALRLTDGGLRLNGIIAKAITMGDEFHQRNTAASLLILSELAPYLTRAKLPQEDLAAVMRFLADTDQFFLNVMMASCKSVMDGARAIKEGTIVTALTRNGREFGIRVSGMGDEWFTAPVNTPQGLFFSGYTQEDANPDIGDSAITESFGVGAACMVAAPAVSRFVGAGSFEDALAISNEMKQIYSGHNPNLPIPTWGFQGAPIGIDIRKVIQTGITPVINTGIAHKNPGIGQVGTGIVRAPLACFQKAFVALTEKSSIKALEVSR